MGAWRGPEFRSTRAGVACRPCPDSTPESLAALSLGQRDARLLTLREWTFGSQLHCRVSCPICSERLEFSFNAADIKMRGETELVESVSLNVAEHEVRFRLPNSVDLLALPNQIEPSAGRSFLLERCLLAASYNGEEKSASQLPAEILDSVAKRMAEIDPQADVELALACPACDHHWLASFDIAGFFWNEINAWAFRALHEVHELASAYGWSEPEVLSISPWRRQFYLNMLGS